MASLDGTRLAAFAVAAVAGTWALYWPLIKAHRVPRRPLLHQAAMLAAVFLAVLALFNRPGAGGVLLAAVALAGAGFFLFSSVASGLPTKRPAVAIGDRYLDFRATDSDGRDLALSSLEGKPFLLKFYRGYWCPYCTAELERWQRLLPRFQELGVTVVAISPDTVAEAARMKHKHGLAMLVLSDEKLEVVDLYDVRHERGIAATPGQRGVFRPLAVPTAILVDAAGIVRWIDQTDDYRLRTDAERVAASVRDALAQGG